MYGGRHSKTQFSIDQYLNDLQKYETRLSSKSKGLRKDNSSASIKKDYSNTIYKPAKDLKIFEKTNKYFISDKVQKHPIDKLCLQKRSDHKDKSKFTDDKYNTDQGYLSINHSTITNKTCVLNNYSHDDEIEDKENIQFRNSEHIQFSQKEEKHFIDSCIQMYNLKNSNATLQNISKEINKRDEVYHVIQKNLKSNKKQQIEQNLSMFFDQLQMMREVVDEFKRISKLEIEDLNELYYFLKSDR